MIGSYSAARRSLGAFDPAAFTSVVSSLTDLGTGITGAVVAGQAQRQAAAEAAAQRQFDMKLAQLQAQQAAAEARQQAAIAASSRPAVVQSGGPSTTTLILIGGGLVLAVGAIVLTAK